MYIYIFSNLLFFLSQTSSAVGFLVLIPAEMVSTHVLVTKRWEYSKDSLQKNKYNLYHTTIHYFLLLPFNPPANPLHIPMQGGHINATPEYRLVT